MNSLTLLGILPLVGALLIAVIPAEQVLRVKQAALGATILVAISAILMWLNFDESNTAFQFVQSVRAVAAPC